MMSEKPSWRATGKPITTGIVCGQLRQFSSEDIAQKRRALSDLEVVTTMQALLQKITLRELAEENKSLAHVSGRQASIPHQWVILRAIEGFLRSEGSGLEYATARVVEQYSEAVRLIECEGEGTELEELSQLAERILKRVVRDERQAIPASASPYIALVNQISLADAMNLSESLSGLIVRQGDHCQLAVIGRVLQIPVLVLDDPDIAPPPQSSLIELNGFNGTLSLKQHGLRSISHVH